MKISEIIDRKILFINWNVNKNVILEGIVKEISPSENFLKINNEWYYLENLRFLELFDKEKNNIGFK